MIRVIAQRAHDMFGVAITIVDQCDEGARPHGILRLKPRDDDKTIVFGEWEECQANEPVVPTIVIGDEWARPLLDALTGYYSGSEDTRALRRDYDHERKRVDQLIGHLAMVTHAIAGGPEPVRIASMANPVDQFRERL